MESRSNLDALQHKGTALKGVLKEGSLPLAKGEVRCQSQNVENSVSFISYLRNIALRKSTGQLIEIGMTDVSRKAN